MNRDSTRRAALLWVAWGCTMMAAWPATAQTPTRPNVILMMADDMGWGEVGFPVDRSPGQTYDGHPVLRTPNLSAMADAGLTFNRFYAADSVCSPSRASFLTGRHHDRANVPAANKGHLPNREMTIAEVAQTQGYVTGHFGKWHLGALDKSQFAKDGHRGGTDRAGSAAHYSTPWDSGYDTAFVQESASQTFNPYDRVNTDNFSRIWTAPDQAITDSGDRRVQGDSSQRLVDQTLSFIKDAVASNRPFMTTVWFTTPHNHLASDPSDTTYGTATNEDDIRDPAVNNDHRRTSLAEMDRAVGRIRAYLQDPNGDGNTRDSIADNTVLVFTSDNGGNWRADSELDSSDRNDGNGGLRGEKGNLYEGGVRVPGIFEWAGQIVPKRSTNAIAGVIDLLPTLMDIWDLDAPDRRPVDGESLVPVIFGPAANRTTSMKWSHGDRASIIGVDGKFKAVKASGSSAWELYDLLSDPGEKTNLAGDSQVQAKLNELTAQFDTWKAGVESSRENGDYSSGVVRLSGANLYRDPFDNPPDFT
ncbi:MAG: sulfatase-like hydrolase/transferase, partial [Myxococcota bacterium]